MSANAGELLETMEVRLKMQLEGITNPSQQVKIATKNLVERLSKIDSQEDIEIITDNSGLLKYIRSLTGDVLAEIYKNDNT